MLAALLLALTLGALVWFVRGDLGEYRRFRRLPDSASRQARYRLWIAKAWLAFAVPPIVGLAALGRLNVIGELPAEFAGIARLLPALQHAPFLIGVIGGAAGGGLVLGVMFAVRRRRGQLEAPGIIGNVGALLPRNRPEVLHAAALSVTAGITEELAFRLFLPLLLVLVIGNAVVAFAIAAALFGAMHGYQGWRGVVATTGIGLVLTGLYLATGSLLLVILLHALIDLNGLVLRPILGGAWQISSSAASRS